MRGQEVLGIQGGHAAGAGRRDRLAILLVLHVSGRDRAALEAAIVPHRNDPALTWTLSAPTLEDVFIELMNRGGGPLQ